MRVGGGGEVEGPLQTPLTGRANTLLASDTALVACINQAQPSRITDTSPSCTATVQTHAHPADDPRSMETTPAPTPTNALLPAHTVLPGPTLNLGDFGLDSALDDWRHQARGKPMLHLGGLSSQVLHAEHLQEVATLCVHTRQGRHKRRRHRNRAHFLSVGQQPVTPPSPHCHLQQAYTCLNDTPKRARRSHKTQPSQPALLTSGA